MFTKDIGIDLGTANILIYVKGEGIVINEPSVVVIDEKTKQPIAFGKEASKMLGRTPEEIKTIKPLKDGVIANFEATEMLLNHFINKIKAKGLLNKPRILICCPTNITQVEKNAIITAAERLGAKQVFIEEEPKVAAVGAGLDISKPNGNMVVDIGGGTTDIAVLSLNGIVNSSSIRIAGNTLDKDIIEYIKKEYKLLIGEKTAEEIKIKLGTATSGNKKDKLEVKGRDMVEGLPKTITITSEEIEEAISHSITKIINEVKKVLEETPPELTSDIITQGIVLTGGGALLKNLDKVMSEKLKVPVKSAKKPLMCVVEGTINILEHI